MSQIQCPCGRGPVSGLSVPFQGHLAFPAPAPCWLSRAGGSMPRGAVGMSSTSGHWCFSCSCVVQMSPSARPILAVHSFCSLPSFCPQRSRPPPPRPPSLHSSALQSIYRLLPAGSPLILSSVHCACPWPAGRPAGVLACFILRPPSTVLRVELNVLPHACWNRHFTPPVTSAGS